MKFHHALTHIPLALAAFALTSPQAWAQDATAPVESAVVEEAPTKNPASGGHIDMHELKMQILDGLEFHGFVDASYVLSGDKKFSTISNTFSFDQAELDIIKNWDKVGFRFDVQWKGGVAGVEQGYMVWNPVDSLSLTFGTFLAPIGWEYVDPTDMYQYSNAYVFTYGLPVFYTGALAKYTAGIMDLQLYAVNGFDTYYDLDAQKAGGGRLGLTPTDAINVGLSAVYNHKDVVIADLDFTLSGDGYKVGAEFNYGQDTFGALEGNGWMGALLMTNIALTDSAALTLRGDWFDNGDGYKAIATTATPAQHIRGTVSPSYAFTSNATILAEYTYEHITAGPTTGTHLIAIEPTFKF